MSSDGQSYIEPIKVGSGDGRPAPGKTGNSALQLSTPYPGIDEPANLKNTHTLFAKAFELVEDDYKKDPLGTNGRDISLSEVEEKAAGLNLRDMTKEEKTDLYIATSIVRMEANAAAKKIVDAGCRMNPYIERINRLEDECTKIMRDLEEEGIRADDPSHRIPDMKNYDTRTKVEKATLVD